MIAVGKKPVKRICKISKPRIGGLTMMEGMNTTMKIVFTKGLPEDSEARRIREEVFIREQGFRQEFDETDSEALHAVLFADGRAVATARAYPKGNGCWAVGRVAVSRDCRGMGWGRVIMQSMEQKLREIGVKNVELSAQVQARGFYESLGYAAYGSEYLDEHCPHVAMKKEL